MKKLTVILIVFTFFFFCMTPSFATSRTIKLSHTSVKMETTTTKTITLKKGAKNIKTGVKWKTSNKKIATVSKGKITAKQEGKATITATYKAKAYRCKVTVTDPPVKPEEPAEPEPSKPIELYVDSTAGEGGNGTKTAPFATLKNARDKLREIKSEGALPAEGACVYVEKGIYESTKPLEFTSQDSGSEQGKVRFISSEPRSAVLTGKSCDLVHFENGLSFFSMEGFRLTGTSQNGITGSGNQDHVTVENCMVDSIGGESPIYLNGANITLKDCEIKQCECGATLGGGDPASLTPSQNIIENCYFHDLKEHAATIFGCGGTIRHNEISDIKKIGMAGPCLMGLVEYNDIHDVCLDASDSGAIYSQAGYTNYGGVTRYNYIHEIGGPSSSDCHGIYWDDVSSGQTAYGNVIVNIKKGRGFMIGGGRDNTVRHNIIVDPQKEGIFYDDRARTGQYSNGWWGRAKDNWQYSVLRSSPYRSDVWKAAFPQLAKVIPDPTDTTKSDPNNAVNPAGSIIEENVIYAQNGKYKFDKSVESFSAIKNNITRKTKTDFVAADKGNYTLRDTAHVYKVFPNFEKIDFAAIGRQK